MALGLNKGGDYSDIVPIVKYNAKAGRFYRIDRIEEGGQWVTDEVEITDGFSAVIDMPNIEVGWIMFAAGGPPDFQLVKLGDDMGPRPSDKHQSGFRVMLKLAPAIAGTDPVRELCSTASTVVGAIDALHDAYLAGAQQNQGKLPVVKLGKVKSVTGKYGTNYEPSFIIERWVDRPKDLIFKPRGKANGNGEARHNGNGHAEASAPPATGNKRAAPPQQPQTSSAPAAAEDDFG